MRDEIIVYTLLHENFAISRSRPKNREIEMSRKMIFLLNREIKMHEKIHFFGCVTKIHKKSETEPDRNFLDAFNRFNFFLKGKRTRKLN